MADSSNNKVKSLAVFIHLFFKVSASGQAGQHTAEITN